MKVKTAGEHLSPPLLKLATYNGVVRETFEIVEDPHLKELPQYFIMYFMDELENFNPERIVGYNNAEEVATVLAYFRQTGILRFRNWGWHPHDPRHWQEVQPFGIYVMNTEAILYKRKYFVEEQVMQDPDSSIT